MLIVGSNFQHVSSTSQWLYGKTSWNISKLHLKFIVVRHIGILLLPEQSVVITTAQMTTHLSAWQTRPSNVHMSCMRDTSGSFVSCFSHEAANVPCWPLWSQQDFNGPGHPGEQQKGEKTNRTKQYKIQNRMPAMTGVMARGKWYSWRWHKCWWRIYNNGRAMSCFAFPTVLSKSFRYHGCSSTFLSVKLTQKIKPHFQLYKFHPEPPDMMSNKKWFRSPNWLQVTLVQHYRCGQIESWMAQWHQATNQAHFIWVLEDLWVKWCWELWCWVVPALLRDFICNLSVPRCAASWCHFYSSSSNIVMKQPNAKYPSGSGWNHAAWSIHIVW